MKKFILGMIFVASTAQASDIYLSSGQSIVLGSQTISCMGSPQHDGQSACTITKRLSKIELYNRARNVGVGGCYIFNNGYAFGVMDSRGKQISMTYMCDNPDGEYCEAPVKGLIQLACELGKCRD